MLSDHQAFESLEQGETMSRTMNTAFVALVIATFAYTQKISSSIVGLVTDTSGAAVQGAEIIILNRGTGISIPL